VERVRVVDDEAHLQGHGVLAHLAAEILPPDGEGLHASSGPAGSCANGGVEGDVPVAAPGDPRARVLPATQRHERPVAPSDRTALEAVRRPGPVEHATCVDLELRDAGRAVQLV
jgi:hypothetical protein